MDGKPLLQEHGAPVRLVIPEMYGYKNVKWVCTRSTSSRGRERLLGAARLRQRRLGRPLERIRDVKAGYVRRFSRVERLLHWVNALGFFFLLATGLILYLPSLSVLVARRQLIQSLHFWAGVGWLGALALVLVLGGRRLLADGAGARVASTATTCAGCAAARLRRAGSTPDRRSTPRSPPPSRSCSASPACCSGSASRTRGFRFASTVILHDGLMYVSLALLVGHLYLALIHPATRHALRGMTLGTVSEEWARRHHGKWKPEPQ